MSIIEQLDADLALYELIKGIKKDKQQITIIDVHVPTDDEDLSNAEVIPLTKDDIH